MLRDVNIVIVAGVMFSDANTLAIFLPHALAFEIPGEATSSISKVC